MEILGDFKTSVIKAISEVETEHQRLNGLIVCGSHNPNNEYEILKRIRFARENNTPFLGICMGLEWAIIEYIRSLGISDATTTEIEPDAKNPVFIKLPKLRVGIIKVEGRYESHWHNYYFNRGYQQMLENHGWQFVFKDDILEIANYSHNLFFKGVQFHPEYNSTYENPHPVIRDFIYACRFIKDKNSPRNIERTSVKQQKGAWLGIED